MAVAFTKINDFVNSLASKLIDLSGDGLTLALTNTALNATATTITGVDQVSYTNISSRVIVVSTSSQTAGTYKLVCEDLTLTASGAVGPFQYVVLYDDDSTDDRLVGVYDYGSEVTMADGDTFKIDFSSANGVLTIA